MKQSNSIPDQVRYLVIGRDPWGRRVTGLYDYDTAKELGNDCLNTIIDRATGRMINFTHLINKPKR